MVSVPISHVWQFHGHSTWDEAAISRHENDQKSIKQLQLLIHGM
jgi:hypothetical protein